MNYSIWLSTGKERVVCITKKVGDGLIYPQEQERFVGSKTEKDRKDENQFSSKRINLEDCLKK